MAAAPAAGQAEWRARVSYERQVVHSELPLWTDWESWRIEGRRVWERGSLGLGLLRSRRFDMDDNAAAVNGYLDVTPGTYIHTRLQVSPGARALPEQDHRLVLSHATTTGWEASAGYRFLGLSPENVHVLHAALGLYLPGWYLRARGFLNPSFEENATFMSGAARRFLPSLDGYVEVSAGAGEEVVEVAAGPAVDIRSSRSAGIRADLFPWESVGLAGGLSYHGLGGLPTRLGIGATIKVRW